MLIQRETRLPSAWKLGMKTRNKIACTSSVNRMSNIIKMFRQLKTS
jgi:hypothetical protein